VTQQSGGGGGGGPRLGALTVGTPVFYSATNHFIPVPTAEVGDEVFIVAGHRQTGAPLNLTATGFTRVAQVVGGISCTAVFHRTIDGSEGANFTVTAGRSTFGMQTTILVSGGIGAGTIDTATRYEAFVTSITPPALTSTAPKGGFTLFFHHGAQSFLTTPLPQEIERDEGTANANYRQLINYQFVGADATNNIPLGDLTINGNGGIASIVWAVPIP
jgi:hypothetical protein